MLGITIFISLSYLGYKWYKHEEKRDCELRELMRRLESEMWFKKQRFDTHNWKEDGF